MRPRDTGFHPFELAAGVLALGLGVATALMWLVASVAALAFSGAWPELSLADSLHALVRLPHHLGSPREAWSPHARASLPGTAWMYSAAGVFVALALVAAWRVALATMPG